MMNSTEHITQTYKKNYTQKSVFTKDNTDNLHIVFIDTSVADYQSLISGVKPGYKIVILDPTKDGITQITESLQGGTYQSVHIVSHGAEANLQLGITQLNNETLGLYQQQLQQWAHALTDDADILLYGCNVASGEIGQAFAQQLAEITGADVTASEDVTGNAELGGDWDLEVTTGEIESHGAFTPEVKNTYKSILPMSFTSVAEISGSAPYSVTVADFNKDNNFDIAVAQQSNSVSVLLGDSSGNFNTVDEYTVGANPVFVTTGDLNKDGYLDLVTANSGSNTVSVLLGDANGSFGTTTNVVVGVTGTNPTSVVTGDFNGDGASDLAVTTNPNKVSVILSKNDGTYSNPTLYDVGTTPNSIVAADFDGDRKLDLAVANSGSNNIALLLGNGSGIFSNATFYELGSGALNPKSIIVSDFNGDGKLDLAVANSGSNNVSILLGNNIGGFGNVTNYEVGTNPSSITVGDFNKDGKSDLAVATGSTSGSISLLLGNGSGGFSSTNSVTVGSNPVSVVAGDFDKDGKSDLVVANFGSSNFSVLLNESSNSKPINTVPSGSTTKEETVLSFNTISISDADAFNNPVEVTLTTTHGTLSIGNTTGINVQGDKSGNVVLVGTVTNINTALNGLSFTPNQNFNGTAAIQIKTDDKGNTGADGAQITTSRFNVSVTSVNDAPVLFSNSVTVYAEADAWVDSSDVQANYGSSTALSVDNQSESQSEAFIRFNLSSLPNGMSNNVLTSATFRVTSSTSGNSYTHNLYYIDNDSWQENAITWANKPLYQQTSWSLQSNNSTIQTHAVDATAQVLAELSGSGNKKLSYAIANLSTSVNPVDYYSRESGSSLVPRLELSFSPISLTAIDEDSAQNSGTLVSTIVNGRISDADSGAQRGIAVIGSHNSNGQWQYSIDNGVNWTGFSTSLSSSSALLLAADSSTKVRFVPKENFTGTIANGITFRAWDRTTGSNGGTADTSSNGGTTAFSVETATADIKVNPVNDAPVINAPTELTVEEDQPLVINTSNGAISISDVDAGNQVVAVTLTATNGTISLNSSGGLPFTFTNGDGVEDVSMSFTGTLANINTALLGMKFHATPNTTDGKIAINVDDLGKTGAGGAKTSDRTVNIKINPVNDAPVNTVPTTLLTTAEETALVFGENQIQISDADAADKIVEVKLTAAHGTLTLASTPEVNITDNTTGQVTVSGTIPKINTALNSLSFTPTLNFNGDTTVQITTNDKGNTGAGGEKSDTDTINIYVSPVNDAPVILSNSVTVKTAITEDDTNNNGILVSEIITGNASDVDAGALQGIAIVKTNTTNGQWQYSTDGGSSWNEFGTVSTTSALLLASEPNTKIRFIPSPNFTGNMGDGLTFHAWDRSEGYNGERFNVSVNGLTTPFSTGTATAAFTVSPVNDEPVISAPVELATDEDTPLVINASNGVISIVDIDAGDSTPVTVTLNATNGTISLNGTREGLIFTSNGSDGIEDVTMTFTGTLANINNALLGMKFHPTANSVVEGKIDITVDDKGNTGSGGAKTATSSVIVKINPVNDAPVNTVPTAQQTTNEDTALVFSSQTNNQILIADLDAQENPENNRVQVTLAATNGILKLANFDGVTATGDSTSTITLTGRVSNINSSLNGLSFTPFQNYSGVAEIKVTTNDQGNTGAGGAKSDEDTIKIVVNPLNDAPLLVGDTIAVYAEADAWVNSASPSRNYGSDTTLKVRGVQNGSQQTYVRFNLASLPIGLASVLKTATFQMSGTSSELGHEDYHSIHFVSNDTWQENTITWRDKPAYQTQALGTWAIAYNTFQQHTVDISSQFLTELTGDKKFSLAINHIDFNKPGLAYNYQSRENQTDVPQLILALNPISVAAIDEDNTNNEGTLISTIIAGRVLDTDPQALQGIAVFAKDNTNGKWQYSTDGTWIDFGNLSESAARLLAADDKTKVRFVPNTNFTGAIAQGLSFRIWDRTNGSNGGIGDTTKNGGSTSFSTDIAHAAINVKAVNDTPIINLPAKKTTKEDTTLVFAETGGVISISDVDLGDSSSLEVEVTLKVVNGNGTINLNDTSGLSITSGNGTENMTLTGTIASINTALASMQFLPKANFFGTETVEITVNDKGSIGSGGAKTITNSVSIDVQSINDAPVNNVLNKELTTLEDTPIVFSGNNLISISDIDAGNQPVEVILTATNGTIALSSTKELQFTQGSNGSNGMMFTGTIANINTALAGMTFNPTPEASGSASIKIRTSDLGNSGIPNTPDDEEVLTATDTININIQSVNDPPINQVPGKLTTDEDKPIVFSKENGNLISISDPDAGANPIQVTFVVTNGTLSLSGTTGLNIWNGNSDGLNNATMILSGTIADINTALAGMTFNPTPNYSGSTPATIEITTDDLGNTGGDRNATDKDTIEIAVTSFNDPPVHTFPNEVTTQEDTPFIFSGEQLISVSDADAGSNQVEVTLTATKGNISLSGTSGLFMTTGDGIDDETIIFKGTLDHINTALAGMTFNPTANVFGEGSVTIKTNDLGNTGGSAVTVTNTVKIIIEPINEPPVNSVPITAQSTIANTPLVFSQATNNRISISDIDALNNPVKVTLTATYGSVSLNANSIEKLDFSQGEGDGTDDVSMTFIGTIDDINAALQGMKFIPTADFSGVGKVEIFTNDRGYTGKEGELGALEDSDFIDITITPVVSITAFDAVANESGNNFGTFRIGRTGTIGNLTVNFAIDNASTVSVNDYTFSLNDQNQVSVEILDGQSFVDVILTPNDDTVPEGDESLQLNLTAGSGYVLDTAKSNAKVTIAANDTITYDIASNLSTNNSINEDDTGVKTLTFTVTRSGGIGIASQVDYALEGTAELGSDYNNIQVTGGTPVQAGTLNFAVGETTKTITVDVLGDKTFEADEILSVALSKARPAEAPASATITTNIAAVKIVNDDSFPGIFIDDVTVSEGNTATFNVTLSNPSYQQITVEYSIVDESATANSDYTATAYTGTFTFNPGETGKTISVTALVDSQFENAETFAVKLANSTNSEIKDGLGIGTIAPLNAIVGTPGADNLMGTTNRDRILGLEGDDAIVAGLGADEIDAGDGNDTIFGDLITGVTNTTSNTSDLIKGGNGSDLIYGGEGKDWLYGEAGDDLLWGNDGADELWGGLGNDYLTGGKGNDIFILARNEGVDTINDFRVGEDVIRLSGSLTYSALSITQVLSNTFIFDNSNQKHLAVLTGVQASTLNISNFI
ncbi:DUF4347 domain-containing protein [Scytonema sp. UIC 10036]|uniref:DUF4347 domain-containing protein n=1 Tax=Scytonema sp. UIC 10036 TaxID=2304196 RepID=UPI0012DA2DB9|nr:DUF4347 domain-containing protein [Scytonema sp. UIC 10036]MUH01324.1 DUF4347 domain-containing protein [Scytonema sp. UIC 10036]